MNEIEKKYSQIHGMNKGEILNYFNCVLMFQEEKNKQRLHIYLTQQEYIVMLNRLFNNMTQKEVGKILNLTTQRIFQIENIVIKKLRHPSNYNLYKELKND